MESLDYNDNINNPIMTLSSDEDGIMSKKEIAENEFKELINRIKPFKDSKIKKAKFDYTKFDIHSVRYNLEREVNNKKNKTINDSKFIKRMEADIKSRHTKVQHRESLVSKHKLRKPEAERLNAFNRLIADANRRLEVSQNIHDLDIHLTNQHYGIEKMSLNKWNAIYKNRFLSYKNKLEENLERRIIQKEKESKCQEDKVLEDINLHVKKASKEEINTIVERLWTQAKRKNSNRLSTEATNKDKEEPLMTPIPQKRNKANYNKKISLNKKAVSLQSKKIWEMKTIKTTPKQRKRPISYNRGKSLLSLSCNKKTDDYFESIKIKNNYIKTNYLGINKTKIDIYPSYNHTLTYLKISGTISTKEKSKRKSFVSSVTANKLVDNVVYSIRHKTVE